MSLINKHNVTGTRIITGCGLLTAAAIVLQYLEIPIPIMPSFIKLDFSDLPALIGAFAYGAPAGIIIELLKNLIHLVVSQSGFVGELSNFLLGALFCGVAGLIYSLKHTKSGALIAGLSGTAAMAIASFPLNLYVIYPLYYNLLGFPEPAVLDLYQLILPSVKDIPQALLIFNIPFTFIKGLISVVISMLLYKRISNLLFRTTQKKPVSEN